MTLSFHVAEIDVVILVRRKEFAQISACWQKRNFTTQKGERLSQVLDPVNVDPIDHRGFECVRLRDEQRALAATTRLDCDGQYTLNGPDGTIERQLADKAKIFERRTIEFLGHRDHPKGDG